MRKFLQFNCFIWIEKRLSVVNIIIDFIFTLGEDTCQQQRPPSEHIYFSIESESDYNSTLATAPNASNELSNPQVMQNTVSVHRQSVAAQQWRLTGSHKNTAQPYMV